MLELARAPGDAVGRHSGEADCRDDQGQHAETNEHGGPEAQRLQRRLKHVVERPDVDERQRSAGGLCLAPKQGQHTVGTAGRADEDGATRQSQVLLDGHVIARFGVPGHVERRPHRGIRDDANDLTARDVVAGIAAVDVDAFADRRPAWPEETCHRFVDDEHRPAA